MKILHCCLSCFYNENYNYQENFLPRYNKLDGNDVMIIASTETFTNNNSLGFCEPIDHLNEDGIRVVRVPYRIIINKKVSSKLRAYVGVYKLIEEFAPDVILFHGIGAWELKNVVRYVKRHPGTKLYVDTHASYMNSGTNFVSRILLHKLYYKSIIKKALPYVQKILCIGVEEKIFAHDIYGIDDNDLELYTLGGEIIPDDKYNSKRQATRKALNITDSQILFVHSGKFVKGNMDNDLFGGNIEAEEVSRYNCGKQTRELLRAFESVADDSFRLIIAGTFADNLKDEALELISRDSRIEYVGWKSGDELLDILCAADVYLQPGTHSTTLQNAMCLRCAVMARPYSTYRYILSDKAWMVMNEKDIKNALEQIHANHVIVEKKRTDAFNQAKELLDYNVKAARLYV